MDIKQRIQELSLDQKAKLYYMGLVRQGKIDTLPEDPKAAYIKDMMGKVDTSAAGLEPADSLDPNASDDRDNFPNPEDLEEIGMFHDPLGYEPEDSADSKEDKLKMAYAAYDKAEMNGDIRGQELALAVIDLLKSGELKEMATELGYLKENEPTVFDDESMDELLDIILKYVEDPDDAEAELDRFNDGGFDAMSDYVTANLDRDPEYKAWYNKLHSIEEEEEDLRLEPEDMDNPDEDLVIIGSGYLDIKSNFKGRPNMTNDELATLGQKVVDQLHKGDKDAAFDYITSRLEEDLEAIKGKHYPDEETVKKLKKGPYASGGQNAQK